MYTYIVRICTKLNLPLDINEKISKTKHTREYFRSIL